MNTFYEEAELYVLFQSEQIAEMLDTSVNGQYVHRCEAVVEDDKLVAGAYVVDQYKLMSAVVTDLPPELEEADELPPSIPDDLEMRPRFVMPWFESGYADAAEALIHHERAASGDANRLMCVYDPDGPLGQLDSLTPDEGAIELNWAIRGLDEPVDDAFVAPSLG